MPTRIYCPLLTESPTRLECPAKQAQHLRVLRFQLGDALQLFNGKGDFAEATIIHLDKKSIQLEIAALQMASPSETYPIHLIQALTRNETMDWIIQKATELGVKSITPIISERTQGRLKGSQLDKKMTHWQEIMISAAEQSGFNFLPTLHSPLLFLDFLAELNPDSPPLFIFDPEEKQAFYDLHIHPTSSQLLIGPEGGFTKEEVNAAVRDHATPLRLHHNILRAETAAIAALSMTQLHFGRHSHD